MLKNEEKLTLKIPANGEADGAANRAAKTLKLWIFVAIALMSTSLSSAAADLADRFREPPAEARPWVWYRWQGLVEEEGIPRDLDAMKEAGIGGFVLDFSDSGSLRKHGIKRNLQFGAPMFLDRFFFLMEEARRRGMVVSVMPMNGWATAGGHWVAPERREQVLVWDEKTVSGPGEVQVQLKPPLTSEAFYQDIRTLAMPLAARSRTAFQKASPSISGDFLTTDSPLGHWNATPAVLVDGNPGSFIIMDKAKGTRLPGIELKFDEPFEADSIFLVPGGTFSMGAFRKARFTLLVSDDGEGYREVHSFDYDPTRLTGRAGATISLPETARGRFFRLRLDTIDFPWHAWLAEVELLQKGESPSMLPRTPFVDTLSGGVNPVAMDRRSLLGERAVEDDVATVQLANVIDLSDKLAPDGTLTWEAPPGDWRVIRLGHTESGETASAPAFPSPGEAWEADKLSAAGADAFLDGFFAKLTTDPRAAQYLGSTWVSVHLDSWECSYHRWGERILEAFRAEHAYDPTPWLPALLGFRIGDAEQTEAFLRDYRETLAQQVADGFVKRIAERAHAVGLTLEMEFSTRDRMLSWSHVDIPITEFSPQGDKGGAGRLQEGIQTNVRLASSAAHFYGQNIVAAEAFLAWEAAAEADGISAELGSADDGARKFDRTPALLKSAHDKVFAQGVNRQVFHLWVHQPFVDRLPGMTTRYGTNFGRDLIWWPFAKSWIDYLARCQALLQSGEPSADLLFCLGEDPQAEIVAGDLEAAPFSYDPGGGYDFAFCTARMVEAFLSVDEAGRFVTKSGRKFEVLAVGGREELTASFLLKIASLVQEGGTVLFSRPVTLLRSLEDDGEIEEADAALLSLFGEQPAENGERAVGTGRVLWGRSVRAALQAREVEPRVRIAGAERMEWTRRVAGDDVLYFISSQNRAPVEITCGFRESGVAELWNPETARIESAPNARVQDGRTSVPLSLAANGSVFVVFRPEPTAGAQPPLAPVVRSMEISGPWQVDFESPFGERMQRNWENLVSWTTDQENEVRTFSGEAVYRTTFELTEVPGEATLSLGDVRDLADVEINGQTLPALWTPPFRANVSGLLQPGENELVIRVRNTWVNRIIGDLALPEAERKTWLLDNPHTSESPLRRAGLLGPVQLEIRQTK